MVSPVTVHVVAAAVGAVEVVVQVLGVAPDEVTVYLVMVDPLFEAGAVQATTDCPLAKDVADTLVGVPGGPVGVTDAEAVDAAPSPDPLVATTLKV